MNEMRSGSEFAGRSTPPGHGPSDGITPERISEMIGAIYDCALDPGRWESTLEHITAEFAFANCFLGITPLYAGGHIVTASVGFDEEWLTVGERYRDDGVALWGGPEMVQRFPLDEPIKASELPAYATRHQNRYYREILKPRQIEDAVAITIAREPTLHGYVAFNRTAGAGAVGEAEMQGLRLLGPHFRRAVTISNLFDLKAIEIQTFATTLDAMSPGVIFVDDMLRVVQANRSAETMLAHGDPVRVESGRLVARLDAADAALAAAVSDAARDESVMAHRGIGIPLRRNDGEPCIIHVLPLTRRKLRPGLSGGAVAALFISAVSSPRNLPTDAVAFLYDLTPAEAHIFEFICRGMTQERIADTLGIAGSTVKTHLRSVFAKTGCRRQVDLVKLGLGVALPL